MSTIESKVLAFINQHYPSIKVSCLYSCDNEIALEFDPAESIDEINDLDGLVVDIHQGLGLEGFRIAVLSDGPKGGVYYWGDEE